MWARVAGHDDEYDEVADKGRLILNAQYDPCPARVEDLDGNAYTRVGPPPEP
jgi:hypothetical protein